MRESPAGTPSGECPVGRSWLLHAATAGRAVPTNMELPLTDHITALCDAVRHLIASERQNLEARTHRPGTTGTFEERLARRDERDRQRRDSIAALWELRAAALPACVAAGYRPETAEARLHDFISAAADLTKWEKGTRPITEGSDDQAAANYWASHSRVLAALSAVRDMALNAAKPSLEQVETKQWMPASKAVDEAEKAGLPVTLSALTRFGEKWGVKMREKTLPGRHKLEVELNSLLLALAHRARQGRPSGDEPAEGEYDEAIKEARTSKPSRRDSD